MGHNESFSSPVCWLSPTLRLVPVTSELSPQQMKLPALTRDWLSSVLSCSSLIGLVCSLWGTWMYHHKTSMIDRSTDSRCLLSGWGQWGGACHDMRSHDAIKTLTSNKCINASQWHKHTCSKVYKIWPFRIFFCIYSPSCCLFEEHKKIHFSNHF